MKTKFIYSRNNTTSSPIIGNIYKTTAGDSFIIREHINSNTVRVEMIFDNITENTPFLNISTKDSTYKCLSVSGPLDNQVIEFQTNDGYFTVGEHLLLRTTSASKLVYNSQGSPHYVDKNTSIQLKEINGNVGTFDVIKGVTLRNENISIAFRDEVPDGWGPSIPAVSDNFTLPNIPKTSSFTSTINSGYHTASFQSVLEREDEVAAMVEYCQINIHNFNFVTKEISGSIHIDVDTNITDDLIDKKADILAERNIPTINDEQDETFYITSITDNDTRFTGFLQSGTAISPRNYTTFSDGVVEVLSVDAQNASMTAKNIDRWVSVDETDIVYRTRGAATLTNIIKEKYTSDIVSELFLGVVVRSNSKVSTFITTNVDYKNKEYTGRFFAYINYGFIISSGAFNMVIWNEDIVSPEISSFPCKRISGFVNNTRTRNREGTSIKIIDSSNPKYIGVEIQDGVPVLNEMFKASTGCSAKIISLNPLILSEVNDVQINDIFETNTGAKYKITEINGMDMVADNLSKRLSLEDIITENNIKLKITGIDGDIISGTFSNDSYLSNGTICSHQFYSTKVTDYIDPWIILEDSSSLSTGEYFESSTGTAAGKVVSILGNKVYYKKIRNSFLRNNKINNIKIVDVGEGVVISETLDGLGVAGDLISSTELLKNIDVEIFEQDIILTAGGFKVGHFFKDYSNGILLKIISIQGNVARVKQIQAFPLTKHTFGEGKFKIERLKA